MVDATLTDMIVALGALATIFGLAATVIYYFGVSRTKTIRLILDVKDLHDKIYKVSVKLDAYLFSRGYIDKYMTGQKGER
jgi:hypothetical protein